jgi:hypothetical protein
MEQVYDIIDCPCCAASCRIPALPDEPASFASWLIPRFHENECRQCGFAFAVELHSGQIFDEQELDGAPDFEIDEEGELVNDSLRWTACPVCSRPVEYAEPEPVRCPHCQHHFLPEPSPKPAGWRAVEEQQWDEEDEYLPFDEWLACPSCYDYAEEGIAFTPLDRDWVRCECCRIALYSPERYQLAVLWMKEDWQYRSIPPVARYVVAADGSGDFRRLDQALRHVGRRAVLVLRPGVYRLEEELYHKGLILQADGPAVEVRITSSLRTVGGRLVLRGVTLEGPVEVEHGRLLLEDCTVRGAGDVGVQLFGTRSRACLRRCKIVAGDSGGMRLCNGALARLTGCELTENWGPGLVVESSAWVRLRQCRIADNAEAGVVAQGHATAFLHRCVFEGNAGPGMALHGGRALLTRCQFRNQGASGIIVGERGRLVLARCDVLGSRGDGLRLTGRGRTLVVRSTVAENQGNGIRLGKRCTAGLRGCTIVHNRGAGVRLAASAAARWKGSVCSRNERRDWDVEPGGRITSTLFPTAAGYHNGS